jgi:hypothetical protein
MITGFASSSAGSIVNDRLFSRLGRVPLRLPFKGCNRNVGWRMSAPRRPDLGPKGLLFFHTPNRTRAPTASSITKQPRTSLGTSGHERTHPALSLLKTQPRRGRTTRPPSFRADAQWALCEKGRGSPAGNRLSKRLRTAPIRLGNVAHQISGVMEHASHFLITRSSRRR